MVHLWLHRVILHQIRNELNMAFKPPHAKAERFVFVCLFLKTK